MIAIVLSRQDFREHDQIVTLYTKDQGRRDVLAKGLKKIESKNSMNLQPLSVCDVVIIRGKEIDHAAKVQPVEVFSNLHHNLAALSAATFAAALIREATQPNEPDHRIFDLLYEFVRLFNEYGSASPVMAVTAFMLRFWRLLGFALQAERCIACNKKISTTDRGCALAVEKGGVLCMVCARQVRGSVALSAAEVHYLQLLLRAPFEKIMAAEVPKPVAMRGYSLVHQFAQYHGAQRLANFLRHASMVNII